jgi:hypothetical protein
VWKGKLKGLANGDPGDQTFEGNMERKLFSGKLLAVVHSESPEEELIIKIKSKEVKGCEKKI